MGYLYWHACLYIYVYEISQDQPDKDMSIPVQNAEREILTSVAASSSFLSTVSLLIFRKEVKGGCKLILDFQFFDYGYKGI